MKRPGKQQQIFLVKSSEKHRKTPTKRRTGRPTLKELPS